MQVLLLPGYSKKNEGEQESVAAALEEAGHTPFRYAWRHWEEENAELSLPAELERIHELLSRTGGGEALSIVGKSLGTFVAAALLEQDPALAARTRRLVLLGIPLNGAGEQQLTHLYEALSILDLPITVCQNSGDPYGAAEDVRRFIEGLVAELVVREADNHRYDYPELVTDVIGRG